MRGWNIWSVVVSAALLQSACSTRSGAAGSEAEVSTATDAENEGVAEIAIGDGVPGASDGMDGPDTEAMDADSPPDSDTPTVIAEDSRTDGPADVKPVDSADAIESGVQDTPADAGVSGKPPRVQVVLFTHIEDQTPGGELGKPQSKLSYGKIRAALIAVALLAQQDGVPWVLQPDWKILEAALLYEDVAMMASTGGKNVFAYLRDDLGVFVDPHSHENGGYNYTDVAYLLEQLGVGGSKVIGGHIWDPSLPQFQHWERFRNPVSGQMYPDAVWQGNLLIGSGTPNHVNDPLVSGVWRPSDPDAYFTDDPTGNIVAVGQWHNGVPGVQELTERYMDGTVPWTHMLTASWNVTPAQITAVDGPATIETSIFLPLKAMEEAGKIRLTDFTTLVELWQTQFGGEAYLYEP